MRPAVEPSSPAPLLDWARFLAAFWVLLCHARPEHWVAWTALDPESRGWPARLFFLLIRPGPEAVVVFFVLSGFLVGGRLVSNARSGRFSVGVYAIDRVSRIFLPLVPALAVTAGCETMRLGGWPADPGYVWLGNLVQLQGVAVPVLSANSPLWSLAYEVWFYVLGGALAWGWTRRTAAPWGPRVLALGLALLALGCLVRLELVYFVCWLAGAWAGARVRAPLSRPRLGAAAMAAVLGVALRQATGEDQGPLVAASRPLFLVGTLVLGGAVAVLLPALASIRLSSGFIARLGARLAAFSFTLYLTHAPILLLLRECHAPHAAFTGISLLEFLAKILVCLVAAWGLALLVERPTPRVRAWLRDRLLSSSPPTAR